MKSPGGFTTSILVSPVFGLQASDVVLESLSVARLNRLKNPLKISVLISSNSSNLTAVILSNSLLLSIE
jgi:hypothetical protein